MNEKLNERLRAGLEKLATTNRTPTAICISTAFGQKYGVHATHIVFGDVTLAVKFVAGDDTERMVIESVESTSAAMEA